MDDYDEDERELTPEEIALSKVRIQVFYKDMPIADINALYLKSVIHGPFNRQQWNTPDGYSFSVEFKS